MSELLQGDNISLSQDEREESQSTSSSTTATTDIVRERILVRERRKMALIQKYNTGQVRTQYSKSTMMSLNNAVRKVLIPRMKFVSERKQFGQFDQPDFSDDSCWVHKVFDQLGTLKNANDMVKAEIWMIYRHKIKEQFSIHRANVTNRLKKVVIKGKYLMILFHNFICDNLTMDISYLSIISINR